jgi:cation transport ATPase
MHGNVRENKTETNKASEKLKFTDAQGINLPYNEVPIIPNGHVQALPKNQTVRENPALSKRIRPSVQVAKASAKRFAARNSNQNTREQNHTFKPEQPQADLLYILALIAMVLLILLLLKNFPLLSLLLFIVALLLVLRYFDLI